MDASSFSVAATITTVEAAAATAAVAVTVRIAVDRGKKNHDDEIIFLHDNNIKLYALK